jgi:hypothetical protein
MKHKYLIGAIVIIVLCALFPMKTQVKEVPIKTQVQIDSNASEVYKVGLTLLDQPLSLLLTQTESIAIKDQKEAKTSTGKIKITYTYEDNSKCIVTCTSDGSQLIIYDIID